MAMIFKQPGKTGKQIKKVNKKLTFSKYTVNVFFWIEGVSNYD